MFAKLKKKIAEEAATAPRSGGVRIPRTISKESITSVGGADSGDDFTSDGSSSRDDLHCQILRRNDQIRKLEAKLSDYAEQLRVLQKTKEKLEIALEKHQDSSIKKFQEQSDSHQVSRAKMAEGMSLALEKKDQEWMEKMAAIEKEKVSMAARLDEMMEQSLVLFQKRDDLDELEGFQQQELAKVKHMLLRKEELLSQRERELQQKEAEVVSAHRGLSEARENLQSLERTHRDSQRINSKLEIEREELLLLREEADRKLVEAEGRRQELQSVIQQVSEDFQKSQRTTSSLEKSLHDLQIEHDALKLQHQKTAMTEEEKQRLLTDLQRKVVSLERRLRGNLSQDEHLEEILEEKSRVEQRLEESRAELLSLRTLHASTKGSLEAQVSTMSRSIAELQTLLRHKEDSSRAYRERTDSQISTLEQQVEERRQHAVKLEEEWTTERSFLQQQLSLLKQQNEEKSLHLEDNLSSLRRERLTLENRLANVDRRVVQSDLLLSQRIEELQQCREELRSQETVNTDMAKALEDSRRQREELQTENEELHTQRKELQAKIGDVMVSLQTSQEEVSAVTEILSQKEEDLQTLQREVQSLHASVIRLQKESVVLQEDRDAQRRCLEEEKIRYTQQLEARQTRISYLEVEVDSLTEQLHRPQQGDKDQNGSVTLDDLHHIHKLNRELEQQLSEKNRTIRQLQQRLAELKRTLQKELKLKPESEPDMKDKQQESRVERVCSEPLTPPSSSPLNPPTPNTMVTNTSDISDSREINFEYLKHVVLKFMSSREAEAFQLIRAVSVLLNFSREEEDMLKQTLEYKMSWFGSKPSPKGIIRPSISGAPAHWS